MLVLAAGLEPATSVSVKQVLYPTELREPESARISAPVKSSLTRAFFLPAELFNLKFASIRYFRAP